MTPRTCFRTERHKAGNCRAVKYWLYMRSGQEATTVSNTRLAFSHFSFAGLSS